MRSSKSDKRLPAAQRREIILNAALSTFVDFGYHDAHMVTIAERSDVTKPILYRHFPGKLDLLLAILDRAGGDLRNSMLETTGEDIDWRESIKHDIGSYFDFVESYGPGYRLLFSIDPSVDQEVEKIISRIRQEMVTIVADHIQIYVDTDTMPPQDIEVMAIMLVGMTESAGMHWSITEKYSRETYEKNLVRSVTSILATLPPRLR